MTRRFSKVFVLLGIFLVGCVPFRQTGYHPENASPPVTVRKKVDWSSGTGPSAPAQGTPASRHYDDLNRRY